MDEEVSERNNEPHAYYYYYYTIEGHLVWFRLFLNVLVACV